MNDELQGLLKEIGVELIDDTTGKIRDIEDVMTSISKVFKEAYEKNKTETNESIIKYREEVIDEICTSLAGGVGIRDKTKNKNMVKSLLLKL